MLSVHSTAVLIGSLALPLAHASPLQPRQQLEWSNSLCNEFATAGGTGITIPAVMECAWFTVPLDYANPTPGDTRLGLARVQAQNATSRKGSLLINPGGPSLSGLDFLAPELTRIRAEAGPDYDLVTFAPRGVVPSGPDNLGTNAHIAAYLRFADAIGRPGTLGAIGNLTTDADAQFLLSQVDAVDRAISTLDDALITLSGDSLKYVGTTAVVRDVARIVDALDGPNAPINWLGVSYGTIIGMQLIQIFPERVGKFILDGVVDPSYWSDRPHYLGRSRWLADSDAVYRGFTRVCAAAGPDNCGILQPGETAEALDKRIHAGLNRLHDTFSASSPISYLTAVGLLFNLMYAPNEWPTLVEIAGTFIPGLGSATQSKRSLSERHKQLIERLKYMPPLGISVLPAVHHLERRQSPSQEELQKSSIRMAMALLTIACGDGADADKPKIQTKQVFEEMIRSSREVSSMFGATYSYQGQCQKWTSRAVERYAGPWNAKPKNPVLVVSTELDPVTPFRSAQLITTDAFLGTSARLVRVWNFGHSSYASNSTCHQSVVFKYLNEDVVPQDKGTDGEDVVCPTESKILGTEPQRWVADADISPLEADNYQSEQPGANTPGDVANTLSIASFAVGAALFLTIVSTT